MAAPTIVVAEDDRAIRDLVTHHLEREGFSVLPVADGQAALRSARHLADLVILDIGLPGIDGFEVARALSRNERHVPILMLTARGEEVDRVVGFELGADDYVTKPFSPRELVARVRAVLRRGGRVVEAAPQHLQFGRLELDERAREARVDGSDVQLKPREFALLLELATHPGVALSRERLLDRVWGYDYRGDARTVDVHVRRLRARIEEQAGLPVMLHTIHGYGYKFVRPH
jgi:two-component system alkaline phosphatase synthesis response regulator PhoP